MIARVLPFLLLNYLVIQRVCTLCPTEEFIYPCSCMTMAFGNHVVCGTMNSTDLMSDIFKTLARYEIHTLLLNSLRLDGRTLPADIFKGLKVKQLRFEDSVFQLNYGELPFQGLESCLNGLDVSNCDIARLGDINFTHLIHLTEVNMNFDSMTSIKSEWFRGGPLTVKAVRLDHNMLSDIEEGAFGGLTNMETFSIADNKLRAFKREVFPLNNRLKWLDLSYNQLEQLPTNMFENMVHLERVVLTGNRLTSLPQSTWGAIWNRLEHLLLKDNPIVCNNEIRWAISQRHRPRLNGSCKAPKELTGTQLNTLTSDRLESR